MKRCLVFVIFGAFLLALPAAQLVSGKGHVPSGKVQVCHKARTLTISQGSLADHQGHGEFEKVCEAFRDCYTKGDHEKAGDEQGNRVSRAPQSADDSRLP